MSMNPRLIGLKFERARSRGLMKTRALVLALAFTVPLVLYGIPYAYAVSVSSSGTYYNYATVTISKGGSGQAIATCNSGDYATGGGFFTGTSDFTGPTDSYPQQKFAGQPPVEWIVDASYNGFFSSINLTAYVVCQTPITVAGLSVPEFGQLYVAIALGALVYFLMAKRYSIGKTAVGQPK